MLQPSEEVLRQMATVIQQPQDTPEQRNAIAEEILRLDPFQANPYLILAIDRTEAGDFAGAEELLWKGVRLRPAHFAFYLNLREARSKVNPDDPINIHLMRIALCHLAAFVRVPEEAEDFFTDFFEDRDDVNFGDQDEYLRLMEAIDEEPLPELPPADAQALEPLQTVAGFHLDCAYGPLQPEEFLSRFTARLDENIALIHSFVRAWTIYEEPVDGEALSFSIALLGEFGPVGTLDDLWRLPEREDYDFFHATNWAFCRLAQRFPVECIDYIRQNAIDTSADGRCVMLDQLTVIGAAAGTPDAWLALLENFETIRDSDEAAYILAGVYQGLASCGQQERANAVLAQYRSLLKRTGRTALEAYLSPPGGFVPLLVQEGIPEVTIEGVFNGRMDEIADEIQDEQVEQVIAPPRPGRNDPCWCGSAKKYKKCHLDTDNA